MEEATLVTPQIISILKKGGVGVLPTDTLYGLVASAFSEAAVQRVYELKGRDERKPLIVLIPNPASLEAFDISLSARDREALETHWPGKLSVVLPCADEKFSYLTRGTGTCCFRVPDDKNLEETLFWAGPLVAPSANPQGLPPAHTIAEAKTYFGGKVDFYVEGGTLSSKPSTVAVLKNGALEVLRPGAVKIT